MPASSHRLVYSIVRALVITAIAFGTRAARAARAESPELDRAAALEKQGKFSQACDELETIILDDPSDPLREAALKRLQSLLPKAAPPLTPAEREARQRNRQRQSGRPRAAPRPLHDRPRNAAVRRPGPPERLHDRHGSRLRRPSRSLRRRPGQDHRPPLHHLPPAGQTRRPHNPDANA